MSDEIGHVHFQQADDDDMVFNKPYSTKTEKAIDAVVRKLVDDAYDRTGSLLCMSVVLGTQASRLLIARNWLNFPSLWAEQVVTVLIRS